jgi:hypothetical protein
MCRHNRVQTLGFRVFAAVMVGAQTQLLASEQSPSFGEAGFRKNSTGHTGC